MSNKYKIPYNTIFETLQRQQLDTPIGLLDQLKNAFTESTSKQLYPFVPIRLVGIIEGFCTQQYQFVIDTDDIYREHLFRLLNLNEIKIEVDVINGIVNDEISFGEYASHLISCNNIQDIFKAFSILLSIEDFDSNFSDIVKSDLKEIFRSRHLFCHEIVESAELTLTQIIGWIDSTIDFVQTISNLVLITVFPDSPQTQTDMNIQINQEVLMADKKLQNLLDKLNKFSEDIPLFPKFDFIDAFKKYRLERAEIEYVSSEGGTIYPLLVGQSILDTTNELIDALNRRYRKYLRCL